MVDTVRCTVQQGFLWEEVGELSAHRLKLRNQGEGNDNYESYLLITMRVLERLLSGPGFGREGIKGTG